MKIENKFILCDCGWAEHQMILTFFPDEQEDCLIYIHIHLARSRGFWRRMLLAIRYIFGYYCRYGHWDEILINKQAALGLRKYIDSFLETQSDLDDDA